MTTYLITYSDRNDAKREGWPLEGSAVTLETMEDLAGFTAIYGRVILGGWAPSWPEWHHLDDAEERADAHCVEVLPDDWQSMPWIEVYNGYRE